MSPIDENIKDKLQTIALSELRIPINVRDRQTLTHTYIQTDMSGI
jgi:hypothetical protein